MGDQVEVKKINVDDNMEMANNNRIYVVPTLMIQKDQKEIPEASRGSRTRRPSRPS